jgi:putative ABC transport system ATP-binding protein
MQEINRKSGTTFIFSTHDRKVMSKANRLIGIEDGRVYQLGLRKEGGWVFVRPPVSHRGKETKKEENAHAT